jgi:hypothetical protein
VSTKPGITILPRASITAAPGASSNLLAPDQDGGLHEIAHPGVHRQNGTPANNATAAGLADARRRCGGLRVGSGRSE